MAEYDLPEDPADILRDIDAAAAELDREIPALQSNIESTRAYLTRMDAALAHMQEYRDWLADMRERTIKTQETING